MGQVGGQGEVVRDAVTHLHPGITGGPLHYYVQVRTLLKWAEGSSSQNEMQTKLYIIILSRHYTTLLVSSSNILPMVMFRRKLLPPRGGHEVRYGEGGGVI